MPRTSHIVATSLVALLAGHAVGVEPEAALKNAPPRIVFPTPEEAAAIRSTFGPQDNLGPATKQIPVAAPKQASKVAHWDCPRPEIAHDLRTADLHTYYIYQGRAVTMTVDTSRIAVKFAGADKGDDGAITLAAAKLGVQIAKIDSPGIGNWRFLNFANRPNDKGAVEAVLQALLQDPAFEFVSPVFDHPTIAGGYVVIAPDINVRVTEARVADADATLKNAAPALSIASRDLGALPGAFQLRSTDRNGFHTLRAANLLAEKPGIAWAEPDMLSTMKLDYTPNDPNWSSWGWEQGNDIDTDAELAWDLTRGRSSIRVLVMDCGVEQDHPDINQLAGRDFTTGAAGGIAGGGPSGNCDRHGTSVAGIITGRINNGLGGAGVAPNCRVLSAKTATEQSNPCSSVYAAFSGTWLANALAWGTGQGCQISNSSFGVGSSNTIANAYDAAEAAGMLHFVSAGNGGADNIGDNALGYPSSLPSVQAVAAIDSDGGRSSFSNFGTGLQFACPGTNVFTCDRQDALGYNNGSDYASFGGTSAASPFAAGIAALIESAYPDLSSASVLVRMRTSALDLGANGYDTGYGWGFPNVNTAIRLFSSNDWCSTATEITSFAYNPGTFSTTGFSEVSDELQESCELNAAGVSHSVWYSFVPPCTGTLDINTTGSNYDTVLAVFRGNCLSATQVACNDDNNGGTQSQVTDVAVTAGFTYFMKVSAFGLNGAGGTLNFNFAYTPSAPGNDLCGNSFTIPFANYTTSSCTLGATTQVCEAPGSCNTASGSNHSVWYDYTPSVTGWANIDTNGSDYDTVLTVWNGCPLAAIINQQILCLSNGGEVACDDDSGTGLQSALTNVGMQAGHTYKIKVAAFSSANGVGGDMTLHFGFQPCPADFNASGSLEVQDIFDFLAAWFAGTPNANFDGVNGLGVQDIFAFLAAWFAGC